jgi:hypothetical protein
MIRRVLVGVKRVVGYNVRVRVRPDGTGVVTDGVKLGINHLDGIAIEEASRINQRGAADEVVVATIGPTDCQQQLRTALTTDANRALDSADEFQILCSLPAAGASRAAVDAGYAPNELQVSRTRKTIAPEAAHCDRHLRSNPAPDGALRMRAPLSSSIRMARRRSSRSPISVSRAPVPDRAAVRSSCEVESLVAS